MEIEIHSVDEPKNNSPGKRSYVLGRMWIESVGLTDGAKGLKLSASDSETIGGDENFFKPARMLIERNAEVVVNATEIEDIIEKALSEGLLNLSNSLALRVIEHLAKYMASRLQPNAEQS